MEQCPSEEQLVTVATGAADDATRETTLAHIDACDACRIALASLAKRAPGSSSPDGPTRIGRYELRELVGQGAMGIVYAAYDPPLDRRVAIKLLRPTSTISKHAQDTLRQRLLREARALAKVAHPNVIAAFDVGEHDGEVFLAMELVEGETLARWLAREPRSTRDIVAMFVQAGEGLAAAHDASVIHRDFKPDNVLVGRDGRARVTDFGLARGGATSVDNPHDHARATLDVSLTSTGALAGTPLFMAAEQFDGLAASARTDQFAFGVALWIALFGARPFDGDTVEAIARNVRATNIAAPPPSAREVPAAVRATLERSLQSDPEARFESMRAMLRALAPFAIAPRSRAPWVIAALSLIAAVVVAIAAARARIDPCTTGAAQIASVFTAPRALAVRQAFERASPNTGALAFARVRRAIEQFSSRWASVSDAACRNTNRVAASASAQCLDALRTQANAIVSVIAPTDEASLERAISAAQSLPSPDVCARGAATASERFAPADPSAREAARRIEASLADIAARRLIGAAPPPAEQLVELERDATARSLRVLAARARMERGWSRVESGEGEDDFRVALERSIALDDPLTIVDASTGLISSSAQRSDVATAELAAAIGVGALRRIGADAPREASRLAFLCLARERQTRDFARAMEPCLQARQRFVEMSGGDSVQSAFMDDQLGNMHFWQGHYETALAHHRSALAVRRALVGNGEGVDNASGNIAEVLIRMRRFDEAESILRDLIARRNFGHHWDGLAESLRRRGLFAQAMDAHRTALSSCERARRAGCIRYSLIGIAECEFALGRAEDARGTLERAAAVEGTPPAIDAVRLAFIRARVARALGQSGLATSAQREARSLLDGVSSGGATAGGPFGELRAELDQWERAGASSAP